ncbi:MAG: SLC13 family permease [bacterium]
MTTEIFLSLTVLLVTVVLFFSEWLRVDVVAILIMIILPWLGLITPLEAFSGFASNAVISIMAVMILSFGIEQTGILNLIIKPLLRISGNSTKKLILFFSAVVGLLSAFMQNIGAIALFLPALHRVSRRLKLSVTDLMMPIGFSAILGGTLTMVGSGPLIILNDLLSQDNLSKFNLFVVTPWGLLLLASGLVYWLLFRKWLLPASPAPSPMDHQQLLVEVLQLPTNLYPVKVLKNSKLAGKTLDDIDLWSEYQLNILALDNEQEIKYAPWRKTEFEPGNVIALWGDKDNLENFIRDYQVQKISASPSFSQLENTDMAGFVEVMIPPRSEFAGKSLRQIKLRKNFNIEPVLLESGFKKRRGDFSDQILKPGDILVVHGQWEIISQLKQNRNLIVLTPIKTSIHKPSKFKITVALLSLILALTLAFLGFRLSLSLFSGAVMMILFRVISINQAYRAIDWRTVFLLAGLIPLGIAMDKTGTANFIATKAVSSSLLNNSLIFLLVIGILSTVFSLFMSNVAATVLLVPLVIMMAEKVGLDPRALALLVGVCASNSFILPTHQVNALIMGQADYGNKDFIRAGVGMTVVFLVVSVFYVYVLF